MKCLYPLVLLLLPIPAVGDVPPVATADNGLTGHYYLSGVMETGSELHLRADGTFEWYISYGAVDQFARGRWARKGAEVVLTADARDRSLPLFAVLDAEPWSAKAEEELLRRRAAAQEEQAMEQCPFLGAPGVAVASPLLMEPEPAPPSLQALQMRSAAALVAARAAREAVEVVAGRAMAGGAADSAAMDAARMAMERWYGARTDARDAALAAGQELPDLPEPVLPAQCVVTPVPDASQLPPGKWTGGFGVRVYDLAYGQGAKDVDVVLRLADGRIERMKTASRGLALRADKPGSPVVAVSLSASFAPGRDQTITVRPASSGILHFSIDAQQIIAPPFETMRLHIDNGDLVPEDMGGGRYRRGR